MRGSFVRAAGLCAGAAISLSACANQHQLEWDDPLYRRIVATGGDPYTAESIDLDAHDEAAPRPAMPSTLTVVDAVRIGVLTHPRLRQAGFAVRAASGRETQAGLHPNPTVGIEIEALNADAGAGGETTLLFEQEFLTAGKRRKARDVAEADRLIEQAAFRVVVFDVAMRIRIAFIAALAAERRLDAFESLQALSDELRAAAEAQVDAGATTELDLLRAQVAQEQARLDAHRALAQAESARNALAAAMGLETALDASLTGDLASLPALPDREAAIALTLQHNGEAEQARLAIERATRAHALARAQATPNFVLGAGPRYSDPDNETTLDVGLGVEIPLYDRNQGEIAAQVAERISAGAALGAARLRLVESVMQAWTSYETARLAVDSYSASLLPTAERTLDLTTEAYRAGKTDYLRLLDAQQTLVRSRIAHLDALEALHEAAATLECLMQTSEPWADPKDPNLQEPSP